MSAMQVIHGFQACNVTNSFCHRMPALKESCCIDAPRQHIVMTHTWNYDPVDGPEEKWSLKTLWDGITAKNCGASRRVADVEPVLEKHGLDDVLAKMHLTWTSPGKSGPEMWADEWNNHGACLSSLRPACYDDYKPGQEVGDFLATVIALSNSRPTFEWLFNSGINPAFQDRYDVESVARPLEAGHGAPVTVQCTRWGMLKSVQYFFEIDGCFQYGRFMPVSPFVGWHEGCGGMGVSYYPKHGSPQSDEEQQAEGRKKRPPPIKANGITLQPRSLTMEPLLPQPTGPTSTSVIKAIPTELTQGRHFLKLPPKAAARPFGY